MKASYQTIYKKMANILFSGLVLISPSTFANGGASADNASAASKHTALAASHGTKASIQLGSAVVATPLIITGAVCQVSLSAGESLMENATGEAPLTVTDKTITKMPSPKEVMKTNKKEKL